MSLYGRINKEYIAAFKAKDTDRVSTLRMLKAALKNKEIDSTDELTDQDVQSLVKMQIKQLKDSAQTYEENDRAKLAEASRKEVVVLEEYLPAQLTDEELNTVVTDAVKASGATSKSDMGKAMGAAVKAADGKADGSRIKAIVDSLLAVMVLVILGASVATPVGAQVLDVIPSSETAILGIKILRVALIFFGLIALQQVLKGVFDFMTGGVRDNIRNSAMGQISQGFMASLVLVSLISVLTVFLGQVV